MHDNLHFIGLFSFFSLATIWSLFLLRYHILVEVWHEGGLGKESKVSNVQSYSAMPADRKPFSSAMPPWARSWCLTCRKKVMSWGPRYDTFPMVCPWIYLSMKIFCLLIMMINMWRVVVVWGVPYFIFTPGQAIGPVRLYLQWYNLGSSFACLFTRKKTRHKKRLVEDRKMSEEIIIILPYWIQPLLLFLSCDVLQFFPALRNKRFIICRVIQML